MVEKEGQDKPVETTQTFVQVFIGEHIARAFMEAGIVSKMAVWKETTSSGIDIIEDIYVLHLYQILTTNSNRISNLEVQLASILEKLANMDKPGVVH